MAILNVLNCLVVNYEGLTQTTLKTLYIGLCDVAYSSFLFRGGGYVKNACAFFVSPTPFPSQKYFSVINGGIVRACDTFEELPPPTGSMFLYFDVFFLGGGYLCLT
jgi:hypothetical protein